MKIHLRPLIALTATVVVFASGCAGNDDKPGASTPTPVPTAGPTATPVDSDLAFALNGGGCYPTGSIGVVTDMLVLIDPEWSPVVNGMVVSSAPVVVRGLIMGGHGDLGGDFPSTHVRSDQNTFVRLDDADAGFYATGNPEELALEWEAGAFPDWAWGSPGDHVTALGRWIFDCGHPGASGGHCSVSDDTGCVLDSDCRPPNCPECDPTETCVGVQFGYSSEMHPPYASAVVREGRGGIVSTEPDANGVPATRADVFVSTYGGGAGDACILTHHDNALDLLSTECFPLSQPVATAVINSRDFTFDVPLPPQPDGGRPAWRVEERPAPGGVGAALDVQAVLDAPTPKLAVTVRLTQPTDQGLPTGYAATLFAGWDNDPTPLTHVRLTVDAAVIHNALQPVTPSVTKNCSGNQTACSTDADCPSGETCLGAGPIKRWRLQAAVNGEWRELSGLESVDTGDVISQALVFDQYLPADGEIHLIANGVSEECISAYFGKSLASDLVVLGFAKGLLCLATTPKSAGEVDARYAAPDFGGGSGIMEYETSSTGGEGGTCSATTSQLCLIDADCPALEQCNTTGGAFALRYRIERLTN
jgi:hypothetical protein